MNVCQRQKRVANLHVKQSGLSLVELLVAMALGIFLTWGATQAFLTGKKTYSMQQASSRIQENGRMAQEFLGFDIRGAGAYGCAAGQFVVPGASLNSVPNATKTEFNFQNSVWGSESGAGTDFATALNPAPLANTDILVVHTATNLGLTVLGTTAPTATQIRVANVAGALATGDIIAIGTCAFTNIVKPTTIAGGTITGSFSPIPVVGTSVMKLDTAIYYVATNPNNQPALYRRMLADAGTSQELMSGVENLQLEYGIQNAAYNTTSFVKANALAAADWTAWVVPPAITPKVSAVRYSLLMRSDDPLLEVPQTLTYDGSAVATADGRLRQIFTGTVGIRAHLQ